MKDGLAQYLAAYLHLTREHHLNIARRIDECYHFDSIILEEEDTGYGANTHS